MEEADVLAQATQVAKAVITRLDDEAISVVSFDILDEEIAKAQLDPGSSVTYEDRTETVREYISYIVTRLLIRGHVDAGEIETRPDDFDLASPQGADVVKALEQRAQR